MKTTNLISKNIQEKFACREMTLQELKLLNIENNDTFEYYVCENWLKFILNFLSDKDLDRELQNSINVEFETEIATKQRQSIKEYKKPTLERNKDYGQIPDLYATLSSGLAKYQLITKKKSFKRVRARNINPFCSWTNRDRAREKIYALLTTQDPNEKIYINFVAITRNYTISKKNVVIWFSDLSFDMFKAKRHNFYPIVSHNLTLSALMFGNETLNKANGGNGYVSYLSGIETLNNLI